MLANREVWDRLLFARRFGFLTKPSYVRIRGLDRIAVFGSGFAVATLADLPWTERQVGVLLEQERVRFSQVREALSPWTGG